MTVRCHYKKRIIPVFYNQGIAHWSWLLPITTKIAVIFTSYASVWVLLKTDPVAVNSQAKISFSDFERNKSSTTFFYGRAKPTCRLIQPIWLLIRFVITFIHTSTGKRSSKVGLQLNGTTYADVLLSDGGRLAGTPRCLEKESV